MHIATQFSIYLINKPGVLAAVSEALAKAKVNILALAMMDSGEHGTLRIICEDSDKARTVLAQIHDRWTESEVLVLELDNHPGSFATIARKLADEHINILYAYASAGAPGGKTTGVFRVPDTDIGKAEKILDSGKPKSRKPDRTVKRPPGRKS